MTQRLRQRACELLWGETGGAVKNHGGKLRIALAYPNTYYIGMSNVGFQAVYRFWNDLADVVCERFFLPDRADRDEYLRSRTPLFTLESQTPVRDFDVVAFSVTFEPDELHVLSMLDLARVPLLAEDRSGRDPLVVVGGPITFLNPEPLAAFVDVFAVGEAEALLPVLTDALRMHAPRETVLRVLDEQEGFYIPSHYEVRYRANGCLEARVNRITGRDRVVRAKSGKRLDCPPPATYVLSDATEMSTKFMVEVSRGCPTLCRFCWAGYNYLPKRSYDAERILEAARGARKHTREIGLVSTAVGAHRDIVDLVRALKDMGFRVSVSSLRFDDLRSELIDPLVESGERTLAVAPEVGSDRLRRALHKRVSNRQIVEKAAALFARGVENLKLYFMVGLPGETDADVTAIVDLVQTIRHEMLRQARRRGRVGKLVASVNPFIPKPGTPFQWHPMAPQPELTGKMSFLKKALGQMPNVEVRCKSPRQELLQALLSLGDRRLAPVMIRMVRERLDVRKALAREGLDLEFYIHRNRSVDEVLPWDHIDNGMKYDLLVSQYEKAMEQLDDSNDSRAAAGVRSSVNRR